MPSLDLFGEPIDHQPRAAQPVTRSVNDMDLARSVLAELVREQTPTLHRDDAGTVRRCVGAGTRSVTPEVAATVNQLLAARYLTTSRRRSCAIRDHGPAAVPTPAGRNAVHRWNAYHRPISWDPPQDRPNRAAADEGGAW